MPEKYFEKCIVIFFIVMFFTMWGKMDIFKLKYCNILYPNIFSYICGRYSSLLSGHGAVARLVHILYALKYYIYFLQCGVKRTFIKIFNILTYNLVLIEKRKKNYDVFFLFYYFTHPS